MHCQHADWISALCSSRTPRQLALRLRTLAVHCEHAGWSGYATWSGFHEAHYHSKRARKTLMILAMDMDCRHKALGVALAAEVVFPDVVSWA